jgi:hypothetical protein
VSINYNPPPTIKEFMRSDAFGRLIAGPVGSGKTTGCVIELLRRAIEQAPGADGLRHTRFAIVRQTLKQLKDTVLKDCRQWLGGLGEYRVSENVFYLNFHDIRSEWLFIPMENAEDQARLLSSQLTGCWISEAIESHIDILGPISGRCGRYPSAEHGVPSWYGIIADTNMPAEMSEWHTFMITPPNDWQIFTQPSGLSLEAENLDWLVQNDRTIKLPEGHHERIAQGRKYYERFVGMYGEDSDWVRRYVKAEFGDDPSGAAVYRESFKSTFHVGNTEIIPSYPLLVGQDFGRNPWSLIAQVDPMGRLLIHEEVAAENIGLEKHVSQNLKPVLINTYLGMKVAVVGDPAGISKDSISEETNFDALKRMGLPCFPAPTNLIDPRLRAVEAYFGRQTAGGPSIILNREKCPVLIRACAGAYRFKKKTDGNLRDIPEKDEFSHVSDALQYICLVAHGGLHVEIAKRMSGRKFGGGPKVSSTGWT